MSKPLNILVVPGTWGREQEWHAAGGDLDRFLLSLGVRIQYVLPWSTTVGGAEGWRRYVYRDPGDPRRYKDHWNWMAAGDHLKAIASLLDNDPAVVVSHSHGDKVVAYAASQGLRVDRWLDICGPTRKDMEPTYRLARPNIRMWKHVYSRTPLLRKGFDLMQLLGAVGDGHFGLTRPNAWANENEALDGHDHSLSLREGEWMMRKWPEWADWLRNA